MRFGPIPVPHELWLSVCSLTGDMFCFFLVGTLLMKSLTAYGLRTLKNAERSSFSGSKYLHVCRPLP